MSLAGARQLHAAARGLLAQGLDPLAQRKAAKDSVRLAAERSFESLAARWLVHWRAAKTEHHADTVERRLKANVFPHLGNMAIDEIEAPDLVAMVKAIEQRGVPDLAQRALQTGGQVFRYALAHGYARRNPASEIKPRDVLLPTRKTNLARIDGRDLPTLLRRMEVYQGTHVTRLAVKLMALTFVRTSECSATS